MFDYPRVSHVFFGFFRSHHPRWCRISSIHRITATLGRNFAQLWSHRWLTMLFKRLNKHVAVENELKAWPMAKWSHQVGVLLRVTLWSLFCSNQDSHWNHWTSYNQLVMSPLRSHPYIFLACSEQLLQRRCRFFVILCPNMRHSQWLGERKDHDFLAVLGP